MAEETDLEKCNFQNFRSPVTLPLTLDRVIQHTVVHQSLISIYTPSFIEIGKTYCGQTYGRTYIPIDGRTFPPLMLLGRLKFNQTVVHHSLNEQEILLQSLAS